MPFVIVCDGAVSQRLYPLQSLMCPIMSPIVLVTAMVALGRRCAFDRRRDRANRSRLPVDAASVLELHGEGATIGRRGDLHRLDLDRFTAHPRKTKRRRLAFDREQPVIAARRGEIGEGCRESRAISCLFVPLAGTSDRKEA